MDIVLGVSMTPTTVRMVLVEGEKADGVTVDHDTFDVTSVDGSANAADHVVAAVLGTKESAETGGHHLKSIGVTWSDHTEATALRDALAAHGIDDVMLVAESHAAASLAQAVGRAVGYATTALLFIDRDTATLSVVQTDDGSVVKVLSRSLHSTDAMAVLTEMAEAVAAQQSPPQGMFVVGSGVDISSVKAHLEHLVSLPVSAPDEGELALARGAALASAAAPAFEATTVGLAYSQDPDGPTAGSALPGLVAADDVVDEFAPTEMRPVDEERKPFLLVGSALTSLFVVGVAALVVSLAISIRPTADERPSPAQAVIVPSVQAPAPDPASARQEAAEVPAPPPSAETIKPPIPVVQEAPQQAPRTVYVEQVPAPAPAAPAPAPAPAAPAPAPAAPPVVAPVVLPPPVVVLPRPQWTPPKPAWTWPTRTAEPDKTDKPEPWRPPWQNDDDKPAPPTKTVQPTRPQPPVVEVPQQPQWPGSGRGEGRGESGRGESGRGESGSGESGSGESGRGSGSGVPGDINGDGCFLVFCAPGGGRH
ncbi:hypothetical protein C6A87_002585 [Mycobacterium sp. ITM-2016-00317]|uniref:DUF7159 family protein n=1 Tax=Mycobacterium sp. ITM-2016-00317 TaxID=2099694 RepID=UPI00287F7E53|nr:hypothetical protein [Mycobacterium sp. ITM-2016-00317]WNG88165.1 hypothetical protein C6A87_002585 [Mycobacterium sp. ITM-2016-00317]